MARTTAEPSFGTASQFSQVDWYFLALRLASAVAAGGWVLWLAAPGAVAKGASLAAVFIGYSIAVYARVWYRREARARAYLAVLPADLVFLFFVCRWSADPMSGVYLAFYLVVALHSFYFGALLGVAAAAGFALLYSLLYALLPAAQRCGPEELFLRLGFAFLIAGSLGLVSRQLERNRRRLSRINRQLQHRNRVLEEAYRHLSIGRLAGEVAHNINNPAAAIVSKVELLRRRAARCALSENFSEDLNTIAELALRIARVVRSLVALSPQRESTAVKLDLGKVAARVVVLFEGRAGGKQVRLERRLGPGLEIRAGESALQQVIVNLLGNAFDAVAEGGVVTIETRPGTEPQTVELRVGDNGHGIPAERLDDIFSPFFTTKDGAGGVGLGLSTSLALVRRLGGTLTVDSAPGKGSTFTVTLPSAAEGGEMGPDL